MLFVSLCNYYWKWFCGTEEGSVKNGLLWCQMREAQPWRDQLLILWWAGQMLCCPKSWVWRLWSCDLRKAWPIPTPGARTLRFPRTMVVLCFWPLPTHLSFVFPLVAEYSAGFQIPLLGAMAAVLVVICTAVVVVATLARKVMSLAAPLSPGHPIPTTHPIPSLVLSCPLAV